MADDKNKIDRQSEPQEELIKRFFAWGFFHRYTPSELAAKIGASRAWVTLARQEKIKSVRSSRRKKILEVLKES